MNRRFRRLCFLAIALAPAGASALQPQPTPPAAEVPSQPDREPREAIAREIARLALLDLRTTRTPSVADYRAAMVMLAFAHDLDPTNTDIIRRQIEASHSTGDQDGVLEHTRALLLREPTDSVALLRLISSTITRTHQTGELRLAAYERFLADTRIDAAVRSRLALDAALLLRERGDDVGFKDKLVQSMRLDSTHKEAAVLAATFFAERIADDPAGRIDLLVNVLNADPIDPNVHLSIARELIIGGAYRAALRFHTNALNISAALGPPGETAIVENRVLQWYAMGPAFLVKNLSDTIAAERDAAARAILRAQDQKRPTEGLTKPEDVNLPPSVMALYILAADAAGDTAAAAGGLREFGRQVELLVEKLRNPRTRGQVSEVDAARLSLDATIQLFTLRLWTGLDLDKLNQVPDLVRATRQVYPEAANFLESLAALRNDRPQETIDLSLANPTQRMSRVAMAMAYERLGNRDKALELYRAAVEAEPLQPAAVWSRQRAISLGADMSIDQAKKLEFLVADPRVPSWIDQMAIDPNNFIRVQATLPTIGADATQYVPLRLSITNQSPIPLALGPDRAISSRFLVAPKLERSDLEPMIRPEVADIDRRLRLLPRETIEVDIWPSPGQSGWTIDALANRSIRLRWKLIQGFVSGPGGTFQPGPMCLAVETEALLIRPLAASAFAPNDLARSILSAPLESLRRLACIARAQVLQPILLPDPIAKPPADARPRNEPVAPPPPPPDLKPIAHAFSTRYATLPPATRAMLVAIVPHAGLSPDMAELDAAIAADQDPLVRCLTLSTRVTDANDERLNAAKASDDPRVRQIAEAVADRIKPGARYYALLTPPDLNAAPTAPVEGGAEAPR